MPLLLKKIAYPIILLAAALLIYAPGLGQMGLYWDDLPNTFFVADRGALQVVRTVATARPALSILFYLPYQLLGADPLPWHLLGIASRWLMVLTMVLLLQDLFPDRIQDNRLGRLAASGLSRFPSAMDFQNLSAYLLRFHAGVHFVDTL
jgi:hypothetical protein